MPHHQLRLLIALSCFCYTLFTAEALPHTKEPADFYIIRKSYPEIYFETSYDDSADDWKIIINNKTGTKTKSTALYWADGRLLPAETISEKNEYWPILYTYEKEIPDPSHFTQQHVEDIRKFTDAEKRSSINGTPLFFFNAIYDSATRFATEQHIKRLFFLGKTTNAHERLREPLARVETKIKALAKSDQEVENFITQLSSVESYNWREISDRSSRSFHSYGIAVDILPKGWKQKNIYWAWRRDIDPKNWMLLPLDKRWMPPRSVIKAFESEGFIWGGKWIVWDNMHFEYHPELINFNHIN